MRAVPVTDRGFTLVEIMVVVVIIGVLAGLALPAIAKVKQKALGARFMNDLRIARGMADLYVHEKGDWPPDGNAGMPSELLEYLPPAQWSRTPCIRGFWDWDYNVFGFTAGLSVENYTGPDSQLVAVDKAIDDGDLSTGTFRKTSAVRVSLIFEP